MTTREAYGLYDAPLWADWLTWLTAFGIFAGLTSVWNSYPTLEGSEAAAFAIDAILAVGLQFLLFGVLPGKIRRWRRSRPPPPP